MNKYLIILTISFFGCINSTENKINSCAVMSDSYPIKAGDIKKDISTTVAADWAITFDPLILPVILKYDPSNGFSIIHTGEVKLLTYLGMVGVQYSIGSHKNKSINGYSISDGDFVVGLIDRKADRKQVFKIEGYNKLKVVSNGKTTINAESGYVEIDVTFAKLEELKFIDNSKISIVNTTDKIQKFSFGLRSSDSVNTNYYQCELEPYSYKTYPHYSTTNYLPDLFNNNYVFQIENSENEKKTIISKYVTYGDTYQIVNTRNKGLNLIRKAETQ